MRIFVDATAIPDNLAGVGRYVDELLPKLSDQGLELVVAVRPVHGKHFEEILPDAQVLLTSPALNRRAVRLLWEQLVLPFLVVKSGADLLFSPHYTTALFAPVPVVICAHDATFFSMPQVHLKFKRVFFRTWTKVARLRAKAIVVPSAATRDEILRYTKLGRAKFFVAPHGVDQGRFCEVSTGERDRVRRELGVGDGGYIAFLGTLEPRKNVPALINGWMLACADMENPPALVLAGMKGWDETLGEQLARVPKGLQVITPGYLPLEDLAPFLSGAKILAYPSLGEGFGLPVLEAMACGSVVLTSPILSLPEVGGDTVAYCGTSAEQIAVGITDLLEDPQKAQVLAVAARKRAATFTWERSAKIHAWAFKSALN